MLQLANQSNTHPDIKVIVQITADMLTGDGIFANTDLMRIPEDGWLIVNVVGDNVAHELYIPQLNHKEGVANAVPVLNSGILPDELKMINYKVKCPAGSSPACMIDLNTGSAACALGMFYRGRDNPVALNTPDIVVAKAVTATTANVLDGTDLEDVPYSGFLYTWVMSDQVDSQVMIRQRNHRTGNYSLAPSDGAGLSVDISKVSPFKERIMKGGQPTVSILEVTGMAMFVVCAFFIDR